MEIDEKKIRGQFALYLLYNIFTHNRLFENFEELYAYFEDNVYDRNYGYDEESLLIYEYHNCFIKLVPDILDNGEDVDKMDEYTNQWLDACLSIGPNNHLHIITNIVKHLKIMIDDFSNIIINDEDADFSDVGSREKFNMLMDTMLYHMYLYRERLHYNFIFTPDYNMETNTGIYINQTNKTPTNI